MSNIPTRADYDFLWQQILALKKRIGGVAIGGGASGAPANAEYVTMALSGGLSAERRLVAGANIIITDGGANGDVTIEATGGGGGSPAIVSGLEFIERQTITSDVTDVTFSGLDGDVDEVYLLMGRIKAAATGAIVLQPNNATTNLSSAQNAVRADANNFPGGTGTWRFLNPSSGDVYDFTAHIYAQTSINSVASYRHFWAQAGGHSGSYSIYFTAGGEWQDNAANITSIVIHAETASGIANGSRIALYRYAQM